MMSKPGSIPAKAWDVLLVMALAGLAMGVILADIPLHPLRLILGLLLALWLPGYALTCALLPMLKPEFPVMLVLYLGLSLVIGATGALLISLAGGRINAVSWTILLGTMTLIFAGIALLRQRLLEREPLRFALAMDWQTLALSILAIALVAGALGISYLSKTRQSGSQFTLLWMLPETSTNSRGQVTVQRVELGIQNFEEADTHYDLHLAFRGDVIAEWQDITLAPNETWQTEWDIPRTLTNGQLQAFLYLNSSSPYRQTAIWLE